MGLDRSYYDRTNQKEELFGLVLCIWCDIPVVNHTSQERRECQGKWRAQCSRSVKKSFI